MNPENGTRECVWRTDVMPLAVPGPYCHRVAAWFGVRHQAVDEGIHAGLGAVSPELMQAYLYQLGRLKKSSRDLPV